MSRTRASATEKTLTPVPCKHCGHIRFLKHPHLAGDMCRRCAAKKASETATEIATSELTSERILRQSKRDENGCWTWFGYKYGNGYAAISVNGKQRLAHRVSYETFVAPLQAGLVLDHLCRNKGCVNPAHLEQVTTRTNTRRAMREACINGHEFTPENTWIHDGKRYCRECRRRRCREYQARRQDAQNAN